jgi:hypothetical protein
MNKKNILFLFPSLFLIMTYFSPRTNTDIKTMLLLPTLILVIIEIGKNYIKLNKTTFGWLLFFLSVVLLWGSYGVLKNNPGALDFLRIYGLWTFLYYFLFLPITNISIVKWFYAMSAISLSLIAFYIFYVCLREFGFPIFPPFEIDLGTQVGIHAGYLQVTSHNVGMLSFLTPMFISVLMHKDILLFRNLWTIKILVFLSIVAAVLSGRRAVWTTILLAPFLIGFISFVTHPKIFRSISKKIMIYSVVAALFSVVAIMLLNSFSDWDADNFIERLSIVFEGGDDIRKEQGSLLIESALESPIFGKGPGIGIGSLVRSDEASWSYELTYHMLLHNLGFLGFTLFFMPYLLLCKEVFFVCYKSYSTRAENIGWALHLLSGSWGLMFSSISNPYLGSFDFLVGIFCLLIPLNILKRN